MGNSESRRGTASNSKLSVRTRMFNSAQGETTSPFNSDVPIVDSRMSRQIQDRRRSVSVHVHNVRRQSSTMQENLVKINLFKNIREVYSGLDNSANNLGEGTWGKVRLVSRRDDPNRKAAVKILQLSEDVDDGRMAELRSEIQLLQKIDHPHIAKLYEVYEEDGLNLYLVMEYLSGRELFDRVIDMGYFKEDKAADAVRQMMGALAYLHDKGIVHRDLKLENFMYRSPGSDNLVLIDFGLSTRYSPEEDGKQRGELYLKEMVGSSYYMAPEVMRRKYGMECDVWSIGVIAYMLLSGHPPFAGDTDAEIMRKVRKGKYHFDHSAFKKVSNAAKDFVTQLLQFNPKERMTAKEALKHEWLVKHSEKMERRKSLRRGSFGIEAEVVNNLKNFVQTNRFKKVALQAVAHSASYEDIAHLQEIFEDIDKDQDGYITMEELQNALKNNPYVDGLSIRKIFEAMDIDKTQKVHLNEFIAATMNHSMLQDEKILSEAFNKLDVSDSGEINEDDLRDLLGRNFDKHHVDLMMREFTDNAKNKGAKTLKKLNKTDFIRAMRKARKQNTMSLMDITDKRYEEDDDSDKGEETETDGI